MNSRKISLWATVEGEEGTYRAEILVSQEEMEAVGIDVPHLWLGHLMQKLRKSRQLMVHGECIQEGCGQPKLVQSLESATIGLCRPHAWEKDQAERAEKFHA